MYCSVRQSGRQLEMNKLAALVICLNGLFAQAVSCVFIVELFKKYPLNWCSSLIFENIFTRGHKYT